MQLGQVALLPVLDTACIHVEIYQSSNLAKIATTPRLSSLGAFKNSNSSLHLSQMQQTPLSPQTPR